MATSVYIKQADTMEDDRNGFQKSDGAATQEPTALLAP